MHVKRAVDRNYIKRILRSCLLITGMNSMHVLITSKQNIILENIRGECMEINLLLHSIKN